MILLFVHGWGFDAGIWKHVAALLPDFRCEFADCGYFGSQCEPEVKGPVIAVTHSFGTMRILQDPPSGCRALVAVNGFDCFTARGGFPGVAPRVVDRMIARFDSNPQAVLSDFRHRCGADAVSGALRIDRLRHDLAALKDMDCRGNSAKWRLPILSLQGTNDPILPPEMRKNVFAAAANVERAIHPLAGHLLPLADSAYCARAIKAFVEKAA